MRWALLFLTIALSLILDQFKYSGYYRDSGVHATYGAMKATAGLFRRNGV